MKDAVVELGGVQRGHKKPPGRETRHRGKMNRKNGQTGYSAGSIFTT